jgi:isopenicillin N synthase-like dioxygenase
MATARSPPTIDIGPFLRSESGLGCVAEQWRSAMQTYGLANIVGHGVSDDVVTRMQDSARSFFALPAEEKLKFYQNGGYGPEGYVPPAQFESVAQSLHPGHDIPPDLVESFVFRSLADFDGGKLPVTCPSHLKDNAKEYGGAVLGLLRDLMRLTAAALDLPPSFFDTYYEKPENHLRLASYPLVAKADRLPGQFGYGEHTDYTGFTILKQDDTYPSSLEVKCNGRWIQVAPVPGAFVVNSADLIEVWTSGLFKSPIHRVVMPEHEPLRSHKPRLSLVFFTGPSNDSLIEPIYVSNQSSERKAYQPVVAGDHLRMKIRNSNK